MTTRVVIADDHDLFRDGLALLIGSHTDYSVVGEAGSGGQVLELTKSLQPDLVLLDVAMGDWPVFKTIRSIKRAAPETRIAILTMHTDRILRDQTLGAGAEAFLTKGMPRADLLTALHRVMSSQRMPATGGHSTPLLSAREEQVLRLLAAAMSNRDIADALSISEGTVKRHTGNIYDKLAARSRIDAVTKGRLLGIL